MPLSKEDAAKGGRNQPHHKRTYFRNRKLAREAGRKGGLKAQENRRKKLESNNNGQK